MFQIHITIKNQRGRSRKGTSPLIYLYYIPSKLHTEIRFISTFWSSPQTISNSQLHVLPHFHLCPIYLVLFKGFYSFKRMGYLILGGTSRLDAFSVYSFRTWLPGDAIGMTAGTPVVRPARSSRTKASSPQISYVLLSYKSRWQSRKEGDIKSCSAKNCLFFWF